MDTKSLQSSKSFKNVEVSNEKEFDSLSPFPYVSERGFSPNLNELERKCENNSKGHLSSFRYDLQALDSKFSNQSASSEKENPSENYSTFSGNKKIDTKETINLSNLTNTTIKSTKVDNFSVTSYDYNEIFKKESIVNNPTSLFSAKVRIANLIS